MRLLPPTVVPAWRAPLALALAFEVAGCVYAKPYATVPRARQPEPVSEARIDHRLLLVGDAGDVDPAGEPALQLLRDIVREMPDRTTVVFLGDNIYERGMPDPEPMVLDQAAQAANVLLPKVFDSRREAERCLDAQIDAVRGTVARAIFLPGNHDWDPFQPGGWRRVLNQEAFLRERSLANVDVAMLPGGGCPGPVAVPLGETGTLVVLDTQWFLELRPGARPGPDDNPTGCRHLTEKDVAEALVAELRKARSEGRWAIVAGHHPLNSAGPHGGYADPLTHVFPMRFLRHYVPFYLEWLPMPVLGTLAVYVRGNFSPSPQDSSNEANEDMRFVLRSAMAAAEKQGAPTLAYVAGHDHSLQVFQTAVGPRYSLVSGLGATSRTSGVGATHNTLFAHSNPLHPGFMKVDFLHDGNVRLAVVEADRTPPPLPGEVFSMMLADEKTPRGARPSSRRASVWSRMRERAVAAWRWWRGPGEEDVEDIIEEIEGAEEGDAVVPVAPTPVVAP